MILRQRRLTNFRVLATLILALLFRTPLLAQETVLELDPAQTQIQFSLGATLHTVHGTFNLKHGTVRYDLNTGKAGGLVVVDVSSGNTENSGRDHKMHKDVLQSDQYPEATFIPSQIKGRVNQTGESQVEVQGVLKLHGSDHPITLTFHVQKTGDLLKAHTSFEIPYQQWGLKNPSTLFLRVSDTVMMDIQAASKLNPAPQR